MFWLLFALGGPPDLAKLGHDSWAVRERETDRCSNMLMALMLPPRHDDPEIDFRVKRIRTRCLRLIDPECVERAVHRADYAAWLKLYWCPNHSRFAEVDVFVELYEGWQQKMALDRLWDRVPPDRSWPFSDFDNFREWCRYNWRVAPMPRER